MEAHIRGTCSVHGEVTNAYKILIGNLKQRDHLGYLVIDGTIIKVKVKLSLCFN
jgi:hypothetical protein